MISHTTRAYQQKIAQFFLQESQNDSEKAKDAIKKIGFVRIEAVQDVVLILEVRRPGILIGIRGDRCEKLKNFIGHRIHILETTENHEDSLILAVDAEVTPLFEDENYDELVNKD